MDTMDDEKENGREKAGAFIRVRRCKPFFAGSIGLFLLLLTAGALYQLISTSLNDRRFPPPGKLVDVGGYLLMANSADTVQAAVTGPVV